MLCCTWPLPFATKPRTATPAIANAFNNLFIVLILAVLAVAAVRRASADAKRAAFMRTHSSSTRQSCLACIVTDRQSSKHRVVPSRERIVHTSQITHLPSEALVAKEDRASPTMAALRLPDRPPECFWNGCRN